jgi:S-(hydroxymethyl)glutathione dehydrogenase/alcohol dehydrogenase
LVALDYSGVCRSQLMEVRGLRGPDAWLPHLLGHEGVGTIVEAGPDVTKVAVGDRVVVGWIRGEGIEAASPTLTTVEGERINAGRVTTFSEYSVVSENRVYRQPAEVDDRSAVLFGCALLTGAGMVLNEARPEAGESVLINGLGGIGLAALIATQGLGVSVIAADPDPEKRQLARGLGAVYAVDPLARALHEEVREHFPAGVDVAIDAAGTTAGIEAAFDSIRYDGGRLVFASHPPAGERIRLDPHDLIKGRTIRGSWGGACRPDEDIPRLAKAIAVSGTSLDFMMPRTYSLDDVNVALYDLEAQRAMRPIIAMGRHE